ncbi:hypothetical protein MNBD_GAMMA03-1778 [hydrothermal vent metagenome]|uniref:histidine kinase n=1 Tax=hydrothermal vent metagenome TaxID=652676 RepID=A0A3B0VZC6_9ZZZZ
MENTPREKFNLTELCQQLGNSYMSFIPNLRLNIIDKDIYIRGSSDLMAQLLDKLIDNAQDFTPDSGYIELGLYAGKEHVFLYLTNSGSQLPNNPQINIFDSLVTARPKDKQTQSSSSSHLGLGLHIVQLIARYHHSQVSATNYTSPDLVKFVLTLIPI